MNKFKNIIFLIFTIFSIAFFSFMILHNEINNDNYYNNITFNELEKKISSEDEITVYFYKDNCQPCSKMKQIINKYIKETDNDIYAININEDTDYMFKITDTYNIEYTPTIIILKKNKEVDRIDSLVSEKEFFDFMNRDNN